MATLGKLLRDLRPYVLTAATVPRGLETVIRDVVIYDSTSTLDVGDNDLLLGVGLQQDARTRALVEELGAACAAALVLKSRPPLDAQLRDASERAGVALLTAPPTASWAQLTVLIRTALAQSAFDVPVGPAGDLGVGDLFAVANAVAGLIDAPITIEDPHSHVVAYSGRQEEADAPRIETIIGRRVPERIVSRLRREGVFDRLTQTVEPVFINAGEAADMPRVAVAVRAGSEIVGSMWAAVKGPLSPHKMRLFAESANLVAIHLARHRLETDLNRRMRGQLVRSVLDGRPDAADAAHQLGFSGDSFRVLAVQIDRSGTSADANVMHLRLADLLDFDLSVAFHSCLTTLVNDVLYAIIPTSFKDKAERARVLHIVDGFVARASAALPVRPVVGVGRQVTHLPDIPRSRTDAENVLEVLRADGHRQAAEVGDVQTQLLLHRVRDVISVDDVFRGGPLAALAEHDRSHGTNYVETLSAYLDAFGDILLAAHRMHVHPNTFRYRLGKLKQLSGVHLEDPDERLMLLLQLRLLRLAP